MLSLISVVALLNGFMPAGFATATKDESEAKKIAALIAHVGNSNDAKFVRNDVEYDAKTAAKFLRGKWKANADDIKTAGDFIEHAASKSSTTGKPYLIRFADGKEQKSADYLREQLKKIESP